MMDNIPVPEGMVKTKSQEHSKHSKSHWRGSKLGQLYQQIHMMLRKNGLKPTTKACSSSYHLETCIVFRKNEGLGRVLEQNFEALLLIENSPVYDAYASLGQLSANILWKMAIANPMLISYAVIPIQSCKK